MTKTEIREWMRDTRAAFREIEAALSANRFDAAAQLATDAAGYAGEVEAAVHAYVDKHSDSQFISGEQYSYAGGRS